MKPDKVIHVDSDVWPYFNRASFDQDKLVSYGDYQYTIHWDSDMVLVVVRRDLRDDTVQTLRFPNYQLSVNPRDGHRNAVLGISPADGRLHMSWDHHNNDLRYTRSRAGFLTHPPGEISAADFEPQQPLTPDAPQRVTYPRFFNDPDENLFLLYRTGSSGRGDSVMSGYDADRGTWSLISCQLFSQEGIYPPWNNSPSRNAYLHDVLFDSTGRLHITWVYREAGKTWASNHDLHYACSDDDGLTWKNNAGETIADVSKNKPILLDDPGIVVREIPVYSWLMNQCAMALDTQNQPHVATFKGPEPFIPKELEHNPPAEAAERLTFYHYWRDTDGGWHSSNPIPVPDREHGRIRRPNLVLDQDNNVYLYWASTQGYLCHAALAKDRYEKWATFPLTGPEFLCVDACKHDRRLLRNRGILSFSAEPATPGDKKGYAILDFELKHLVRQAGDALAAG